MPILSMKRATLIAAAGLVITTMLAGCSSPAGANQLPAKEDAATEIAEVEQVMAKYTRDTDDRDGDALAALFTSDGSIRITSRAGDGSQQPVSQPITGRKAIAYAVGHAQAPLGPLQAELHVVSAPITSIKGDNATTDMQFITYAVVGSAKPSTGWAPGTAGAQGTIHPFEAGYYRAKFVHSGDSWLISELTIAHDLPIVLPS